MAPIIENKKLDLGQDVIQASSQHQSELEIACALVEQSTFAITMQTSLKLFRKSEIAKERAFENVRKNLGLFRNQLNRKLTGNGWTRNNAYLPIFVATIEGIRQQAHPDVSAHIHAFLGNGGPGSHLDYVMKNVMDIWSPLEIGTKDILVENLREKEKKAWAKYIMKEGRRGDSSVLEWSLIQAPDHIMRQALSSCS